LDSLEYQTIPRFNLLKKTVAQAGLFVEINTIVVNDCIQEAIDEILN
jgi:hypothetical protein